MQRSRAFTIKVDLLQTEQNAWIPRLKAICESYPTRFQKLLIGGPEIAPSTGLRHVHVYVQFEHQKQKHHIIPLLHLTGLTWHIDEAKKCDYKRISEHHCKMETKENGDILYLFKHPTEIEIEHVNTPYVKQKTTMSEIRSIIESTGDINQVKDYNYAVYMRHSGFIDKECNKFRPATENIKQKHYWIHGLPGTGKTAICHVLWPKAHYQDCCNPNFEDYDNQDTVVFNDFDNKALRLFTVGKMKNLCDPAGTKCKINYGCVHVKSRMVITSNYTIKECFQFKGKNAKWQDEVEDDDPDYLALKRRFVEIPIQQFLFKQDLQLKCKSDLRKATNEEECFEPYDPEHKRNEDPYSECNQTSVRSYHTSSTQTD